MARKVITEREYLLKSMTKENKKQSDSPGSEDRLLKIKINTIRQMDPFWVSSNF